MAMATSSIYKKSLCASSGMWLSLGKSIRVIVELIRVGLYS